MLPKVLLEPRNDIGGHPIVDTGHPALLRMWDKGQRGYRAMGYRIAADSVSNESLL